MNSERFEGKGGSLQEMQIGTGLLSLL